MPGKLLMASNNALAHSLMQRLFAGTTSVIEPSIVTLANRKQFEAPADISLLDAARSAGLVLEHSCRTGRCGSCRVQVLGGQTRALLDDSLLSPEERAAGWILSCASAATCDLELDAEDLGVAAAISVKTLPARIASLEQPAPGVLRVKLRLPPNSRLEFLPGQYLNIIGPTGVRRSYSLAAAPAADGGLELQVRAVAQGQLSTYWFEQAKQNDLLRLEGPHGSFFLREVAGRDVVFLATGTGIAPLKAMMEALQRMPAEAHPRSLHLLWGGRLPIDLYWSVPDMPAWFSYTPVLSRAGADWTGARGHVQDVLLQQRPDMRGIAVYACGSLAMIEAARRQLLAAGVLPRDFHSDAFVSA
ncbi:2Fe-2S iron-sulfur cluster-binding protein [Paucibacter sp. Y2R2-4]|uniref:2Fe-2S iron-sulfur cluster-binding protein n=1 Tax=Paucibacter sp. Y2R2-4 TaxID=2893553 RepID=UPI0021E477EC|nr:2Fe-2S iron-sulfur cluster-binding protein [Paucibacter sp. Y2R2-4]MCV2348155.1 FAD-binding oxidoreductase [Paucibacter sp. Y2R2-4]